MHLRRLVATIAAAVCLCVAAASGQGAGAQPGGAQAPQAPVFRAGTRTIPVYASVTDALGRFVLDLQREEFELRVDGRVQPLSLYARGQQPITAVVLLDASRSMVNGLETVVTAADHFVVRMMPGDHALVGSFSDDIRFSPGFTDDRDELARQVNDLFDLRIGLGTSLWDAIGKAAEALQEAPEGRRAVVVFTDGDDTASLTRYTDVVSAVRRADAMVFAVLIRGIERLPENRRGRRVRPQDLPNLATATGGGYYPVRALDDLNAIATRIGEELHSQYVLGFVPTAFDGKEHKIEVRVTRPNVKVRARDSYLASTTEGNRP